MIMTQSGSPQAGRRAFAHDAVVAMNADADPAAPGGAITTALCGHWEHEPPCPLAPHHTAARRDGRNDVVLRILFATEPDREREVRMLINQALGAQWEVRRSGAGVVQPAERAHADRLVRD